MQINKELDKPSVYIQKAKDKKKEIRQLLEQLKKAKPPMVDVLFHDAHEEVFAHTDCLQCANCCKTTGPLFTSKDIERIANHLGMKAGDFTQQYLHVDEDQDYVLKTTPCNFLLEDNRCSIYEVRPKACREYPHTDRRDMKGILDLTYQNAMMCPAVFQILEKIELKLKLK